MHPGSCTVRAVDPAHRWGRGVGGPDTIDNIMHACRACHDYSGAHKTESYEQGWQIRTTVPSPVPADIPVRYRGIWIYLTPDGGVRPYTTPMEGTAVTSTPITTGGPPVVEAPDPLPQRAPCLNCDPHCSRALARHARRRTGAVIQHMECGGCNCRIYRRAVPPS